MTTGLESVDAQHRELIGLLNQLAAAMERGQARPEVGAILDALRAYVGRHFAHEEACMARYACPAAEANAREHREFAAILADFGAEFDANGPTPRLVLRVEDQLAWWLDNHIRDTDTQLLPCVRAAAPAGWTDEASEARRT